MYSTLTALVGMESSRNIYVLFLVTQIYAHMQFYNFTKLKLPPNGHSGIPVQNSWFGGERNELSWSFEY